MAPLVKSPGRIGDPIWLPDVLQAFGVRVREYPAWKDRGHGDFGRIGGIVCHHTGHNHTSADFIAHHPDLGLCSQMHLSRDGLITVVGAGIAWHAGAGSWPGLPTNAANQVTIGIEAQSDGTTPWPEEQLDAYYRTCAAICWYLGLHSATVIGHKEWAGPAQGKWDPGLIDMPQFRARVQYYIDNPPFMSGDDTFMTAFTDIETRFGSRVPGSTVTMRPIDALLNADAHSFVARANSEALLKRMDQLEAKLDKLTK